MSDQKVNVYYPVHPLQYPPTLVMDPKETAEYQHLWNAYHVQTNLLIQWIAHAEELKQQLQQQVETNDEPPPKRHKRGGGRRRGGGGGGGNSNKQNNNNNNNNNNARLVHSHNK